VSPGAVVTALVGPVSPALAADVKVVKVQAGDHTTSTGVTITPGTAAAIYAFGRRTQRHDAHAP